VPVGVHVGVIVGVSVIVGVTVGVHVLVGVGEGNTGVTGCIPGFRFTLNKNGILI